MVDSSILQQTGRCEGTDCTDWLYLELYVWLQNWPHLDFAQRQKQERNEIDFRKDARGLVSGVLFVTVSALFDVPVCARFMRSIHAMEKWKIPEGHIPFLRADNTHRSSQMCSLSGVENVESLRSYAIIIRSTGAGFAHRICTVAWK